MPPAPAVVEPPPLAPPTGPTGRIAGDLPGSHAREFPLADGTPVSERDYLHRFNHKAGAEWVDGRISLLPVPSRRHQKSAAFLYDALRDHLRKNLPNAELHFAGLRLRVPDGRGGSRFREPDLLLLLDADDPRAGETHFEGADLCVEVVSPDRPARDTREKRAEYARAGVREYWIVDNRPRDARGGGRTVTVLTPDAAGGFAGGPPRDGETAASALLPGFAAPVTDCLGPRQIPLTPPPPPSSAAP